MQFRVHGCAHQRMKKGKVLLKVKDELDGVLPSKGKAPAHPKGVKLEEDSNETTAEPPNRGYKLPDGGQVNEAREALRSSLMDLLRGVADKNNNGGSTYVPKSSFMRNTNAVKYEVVRMVWFISKCLLHRCFATILKH